MTSSGVRYNLNGTVNATSSCIYWAIAITPFSSLQTWIKLPISHYPKNLNYIFDQNSLKMSKRK